MMSALHGHILDSPTLTLLYMWVLKRTLRWTGVILYGHYSSFHLVHRVIPRFHLALLLLSGLGMSYLLAPMEWAYIYVLTVCFSLVEDPEMTSAIMIHTLNKHPDKVKVCIDTLLKYLDNAINHPDEEKYRKIRVGNKAFQERVASIKGTEEFMQAAGFLLLSLPHEDHEEHFWVLSEEMAKDTERLSNIKEVLLAAEPIKPQLDRAMKVFHPSNRAAKFEIPDEFYNVSPAELKKEQQRKEEAVEKLGMLRTKAMRERDELKELRKYRFTLLRVRFPDGVLLQGVFKAHEKLTALRQFVGEQLVSWLPFNLVTSTGQRLTEDSATLAELNLAPAAVVNFSWDEEVQADIAAQRGAHQPGPYLKEETIALIQSLP